MVEAEAPVPEELPVLAEGVWVVEAVPDEDEPLEELPVPEDEPTDEPAPLLLGFTETAAHGTITSPAADEPEADEPELEEPLEELPEEVPAEGV